MAPAMWVPDDFGVLNHCHKMTEIICTNRPQNQSRGREGRDLKNQTGGPLWLLHDVISDSCGRQSIKRLIRQLTIWPDHTLVKIARHEARRVRLLCLRQRKERVGKASRAELY